MIAKPTVILIGADKGGVGKTTVARTLVDYLTAQGIPLRAFDTEAPKGALYRFHPKITEIVDVTEVPGQMSIFDTVSESNVTLIDVRAGQLSSTLHTLRNIEFLDFSQKGTTHFRCLSYPRLLHRVAERNPGPLRLHEGLQIFSGKELHQ